MLSLQPTIPIHLGVIEFENAVPFAEGHVHVVGSGEHFVVEGAEFGGCAYVVDFVDYGFYGGIFVDEDFCYQFLVGEVFVAEV